MVVPACSSAAYAPRHGEEIAQAESLMPLVNDDKEAWIATLSGNKFKLPDPDPESICLKDIAHSLSLTARFAGHTAKENEEPVLLSVADHTVRLVEYLQSIDCMMPTLRFALLHDASEAYLGDVPSPWKMLLPDYTALEEHVTNAIMNAFGVYIEDVDMDRLHFYDGLDCMVEARQFVNTDITTWFRYREYFRHLEVLPEVDPRSPWYAKKLFLKKAAELGLKF